EGTLLGDLRRLDIQRQITAEQLRESIAAAAAVANELAITDTRVRQLQEQETASRPNLKARLIEIYKLGQGRYLRLLLSASHVRQIGQASRMVATLARIDRDRVALHRHTITELKVTRATLEGRSQRLQAL